MVIKTPIIKHKISLIILRFSDEKLEKVTEISKVTFQCHLVL